MIENVVNNGIKETVPEMKTYHFHVTGTAATDDLTPPTDKRIVIYGISDCTLKVTNQTNSTVGGTLSFGTGGMIDHNKVLAAFQKDLVSETSSGATGYIKVIGGTNEIVRLTNMTFTAGAATAMINIFYQFI